MEETTTKRAKKVNKPYRKYLIALVLVILLGVGGYFGWMKYQEMQNSPEAQAAKADAEKKDILAELGKLMVLPEGDPVLFKVNDEETMKKQQAFFKDTKNDDVLLVFQESSKAIIYRPSTGVIVNVGPINFDKDAEAETPNTTTTP